MSSHQPHTCSVCKRRFKDVNEALSHVINEHQDHQIACPYCDGRVFKSNAAFRLHLTKAHPLAWRHGTRVNLKCRKNTCNAQLSSTDALGEHYRQNHSATAAEIDMLVGANTQPFVAARQCEHCDAAGFEMPLDYAQHLINAHPHRHLRMGHEEQAHEEPQEVRLAGALDDEERQARRPDVERFIEDVTRMVRDEEGLTDEDHATIEEVANARPAPHINWTKEGDEVAFDNVRVTLDEITRHRHAPGSLVHKITRSFDVHFINRLRDEALSSAERLALFQQAMVQAFTIILLDRKLAPRGDLSHTAIILETDRCGFLRTAMGKCTRETVADIVSYFAQAAQSGSDDLIDDTEGPLTEEQLQQRPIANVLNHERVRITLQTMYYTPADAQQERQMRAMSQQIDDNARLREVEPAQRAAAAVPEGSVEEQNRRISATVNRQRRAATYNKREAERIFGVPERRRRGADRRQQQQQQQPSTSAAALQARGYAPSRMATIYNRHYPSALYHPEMETNCIVQAITYLVRHHEISTGSDKNKKTRLDKLFTSRSAKRQLLSDLSNEWFARRRHTRDLPSTINEARLLMRMCSQLHAYNLHIAVVHDDDSIEHVEVRGACAPRSPCANDLRLVFPVHTEHFYPALTYENALPVTNGRSLCGRCFTLHELGERHCPPSSHPCPLCKKMECHNRDSTLPADSQIIECTKCALRSYTPACAKLHDSECKFIACRYCDGRFNNVDIEARLQHYILKCNVSKCAGCGYPFRGAHVGCTVRTLEQRTNYKYSTIYNTEFYPPAAMPVEEVAHLREELARLCTKHERPAAENRARCKAGIKQRGRTAKYEEKVRRERNLYKRNTQVYEARRKMIEERNAARVERLRQESITDQRTLDERLRDLNDEFNAAPPPPGINQLDLRQGKVELLRDEDRRMFIIDTEADMANGEHVVTHVCVAELEINYETGEHKIERYFHYDYEDEVPDINDISEHGTRALLGLHPKMRRALGGIGAFVVDMCNGLFQNSIMLAHNMSGYDSLHIVRLLTQQLDDLLSTMYDDRAPLNIDFDNVIVRGTALIMVEMPALNMSLRDTKLILPGSLANLARSFGVEGEKGVFPYTLPQIEPAALGREVRQAPIYYHASGLPPLTYYVCAADDEKKRARITEWHRKENDERIASGRAFVTSDERRVYCRQDVKLTCDVVAKASVEEFKKTGRQLFTGRPTITSYTYGLFMEQYMGAGQIAILPEQGYGEEKGSRIADRYALLLMHQHNDDRNKRVFWRRNKREAHLCGYRVDACVVDLEARAQSELTYEGLTFHEVDGVAFHGDPQAPPDAVGNVYTGVTNERARADTARRRECLQRCVGVDRVVAHTDVQVQQLLDANPEAAAESSMYFLHDDPMRPREALQGGRSNMHATSCQVDFEEPANERIEHGDIQSLYPWVMCSDYPVGEPRIVFGAHANSKQWRDRNFKYFVMRCVLLPPRNLRVPGIGFHTYNKKTHVKSLMFGLCRSCTELTATYGGESVPQPCLLSGALVLLPIIGEPRAAGMHSERERAVRVYLTSEQLQRATETDETGFNMGYRLLAVNELWGWEETSPIFRRMIAMLMLDKLRATAPSKLGLDTMTREEQVAFIAAYCRRLDPDMDEALFPTPEEIRDDPVAYMLAKLKVNSVWGYCCQRMQRLLTRIVHNGQSLLDWMRTTQCTHTLQTLEPVGTRRCLVQFKPNRASLNRQGNVFVGIVTTSKGQLELLKALLIVEKQVLYMDTDSCYYFTTSLLPARIPLGPLVGEWSDEGVGYRRALRAKTGDPTADSTITNFKCLATKSCMKVMAPTRRDYWGDGSAQMQPAEKMALKGISRNGYNSHINIDTFTRLGVDTHQHGVGLRDEIKRNLVGMSLTSRQAVERRFKRVQRKNIPGRDHASADAMPLHIRQLLPPGFRAPGCYMNGVPVAPEITERRLFEMMRPRAVVVGECPLSECKIESLLRRLHRHLSLLPDTRNDERLEYFKERTRSTLRLPEMLLVLSVIDVRDLGTDAEAREHVAQLMKSYLGSYGRIPECVEDELLLVESETPLPDNDVRRSPLLIKFVRQLRARTDGEAEAVIDALISARDYPEIIVPSRFY